ncbi:MAG: SulP family inorganic anion transporter [Telluria sp.]
MFPFLAWPRPTAATLKRDALSGFSIGLVLIPQAIAYATLAGMPPETGLYAALLPAVVGILWGSSPLLGVGPVALTSLLVFGSLTPLAPPGTGSWVVLAIWLSLYAGAIQFLLGAYRLGRIANVVSQPVIVGFINAAAILIMVSQLPALLGVSHLPIGDLDMILQVLAPSTAWLTALFGFVTLVLLVLLNRYFPTYPTLLLVTLLGILASWAIDYESYGGQVVGTISSALPRLSMPPSLSLSQHRDLWPAAMVLALISFTEAMSSCREIARRRREQWDENQELIGQGLAKIVSGLSGAFPVSGSFSRSAMYLYTGAASGWSSVFSALCVLVTILFLTEPLSYLPLSVLAAIIIVPVFRLLQFGQMLRLFKLSRDEGTVALVTFVSTLAAAPRLHWGVFAGIGLTMLLFFYRRSDPRILEVGQHPNGLLRDRTLFQLPSIAPDVYAVRIDAGLSFFTAAALERTMLDYCVRHPGVKRVLLCCGSINFIDATGIDTLESLHTSLKMQNVELYLSAVKQQVLDVVRKTALADRLGSDHLFPTDADAVAALRRGRLDEAAARARAEPEPRAAGTV